MSNWVWLLTFNVKLELGIDVNLKLELGLDLNVKLESSLDVQR